MTKPCMTKPCLFCDKPLGDAGGNDFKTYQPYDGGEVRFVFAYGSGEYDLYPGRTEFRGLICDECAGKYVDRMQRRGFGFHGEELPQQK